MSIDWKDIKVEQKTKLPDPIEVYMPEQPVRIPFKWHDVRKDPYDLPDKPGEYYALVARWIDGQIISTLAIPMFFDKLQLWHETDKNVKPSEIMYIPFYDPDNDTKDYSAQARPPEVIRWAADPWKERTQK